MLVARAARVFFCFVFSEQPLDGPPLLWGWALLLFGLHHPAGAWGGVWVECWSASMSIFLLFQAV
jgi:hypothetical protein